jgi:hypothetical protein
MITLSLRSAFRVAQLINPGQFSLPGIDPFLGSDLSIALILDMDPLS